MSNVKALATIGECEIVESPAYEMRPLKQKFAEGEQQESHLKMLRVLWDTSSKYISHACITKFNLKPFGVRQKGEDLVVPLKDKNGVLRGLQLIAPDGLKRYASGSIVFGCSHIIGDLDEDGFAIICADYEVGAALHIVTGMTVIIAFYNQNIPDVLQALDRRYDMTLVAPTNYVNNDHIQEYDDEAVTFEMVLLGQFADPKFDAEIVEKCQALGITNPVNWHEMLAAVGIEAMRKQLVKHIR